MKLLQGLMFILCLLTTGATHNMVPNSQLTPLEIAFGQRDTKTISNFIEQAGTNMDKFGEMLLSYALKTNDIEFFKFLTAKGAKIYKTLLVDLAEKADDYEEKEAEKYFLFFKEITNMFLQQGFSIDEINEDGVTALLMATKKMNHRVMNYLLEMGANINAKSNDGSTVLGVILSESKKPTYNREYITNTMRIVTRNSDNTFLKNYTKEVFDLLNHKPTEEYIMWLNNGANIKDLPKGKASPFAISICSMPNATPPPSFDRILKRLSVQTIQNLITHFINGKCNNYQALELITHFLLNQLEQKDARNFLKFDQPNKEDEISKLLHELLQGKTIFTSEKLNFIEQIYLYAKLKHVKTPGNKNAKALGTMIRRYMTTLVATLEGPGGIVASFEPTSHPLVSPEVKTKIN